MASYDIFISYNWDIKERVNRLYCELTQKYNLKVWMDQYEIGSNRLVDELSNAILSSKIFLCCITKKYTESENCKDEIDYAKNLKKNMIVLMFERLTISDLGGVGFIIGPKVRFNCYKDPQMFENCSGEIFESIIKEIKKNLEISDTTSDTLLMNDILETGESIVSSSKQYYAVLQSDGNFVLYKSLDRKIPLWATNTWNSQNPKPFNLKITPNGELLLSDKEGNRVWKTILSNERPESPFKLVVQNDGNMVLYNASGKPTWDSKTQNR
ncbi:unnamed protein product [Brachionus calyciflorus]|uniref:TIR domain-containing protein n=1 Tax=Brachionus calyciflorus TaxID=104777 RepID=A0A814PJM4_9BILA|nr:unnamed protein product [Brachionus calyciflorus]